MTLLVIGQSHVAAVRAAHAARRASGGRFKRTRGLHTLEARFLPEIVPSEDASLGFAYNGELVAHIDEELATYGSRVASVIGGNAHAVLALIRHPRPWDFRLPGEEGDRLPLDPGAEPLPIAFVRSALEERISHDLLRLRLLFAVVGPFIQVESPPPLKDGRLIAQFAGDFFRDRGLEALGVAGEGLRWRVWRLGSAMIRSCVESLGCRYLPVPAAALDDDGFLLPAFAADATHGNAAYGELLIQAIEQLPR